MQVPCIFPMTECWREDLDPVPGDPFSGGDGGSWGCGRMHPPGCCLRVQQAGIARSKTIYILQ